jgi:hypothetical protein
MVRTQLHAPCLCLHVWSVGKWVFPVSRVLMAIVIVLLSIISQLRPGADLSRITLPTFILEPKSMLERITKYVLVISLDFVPPAQVSVIAGADG